MEEIRHFFACIENDEEPLSTGRDGTEATRIALSMIESVKSGKIINLP